MVLAASYPPLQKAQGWGTHSLELQTEKSVKGGPPVHLREEVRRDELQPRIAFARTHRLRRFGWARNLTPCTQRELLQALSSLQCCLSFPPSRAYIRTRELLCTGIWRSTPVGASPLFRWSPRL